MSITTKVAKKSNTTINRKGQKLQLNSNINFFRHHFNKFTFILYLSILCIIATNILADQELGRYFNNQQRNGISDKNQVCQLLKKLQTKSVYTSRRLEPKIQSNVFIATRKLKTSDAHRTTMLHCATGSMPRCRRQKRRCAFHAPLGFHFRVSAAPLLRKTGQINPIIRQSERPFVTRMVAFVKIEFGCRCSFHEAIVS